MKKYENEQTNQRKWYAPKQRFSIRKYHFGAASILLGVALSLAGGVEASEVTDTAVASSETTVVTAEATPASEVASVEEPIAASAPISESPASEVVPVEEPVAASAPVSESPVSEVAPIATLAATEAPAPAEEMASGVATENSPNNSGTVSGSLTSQSPTSDLKIIDTVTETLVLDISGDAANYSGGYLEVRIENGSQLNITASPVNGVTATISQDGTAKVIKYTFLPTGLNGGAYYSLKFSYSNKAVDNRGNIVDALNDNNFSYITTANFYDADGLLVEKLGTQTHNFAEAKNGADIKTPMTNRQLVGYDLNKDGLVDSGAGALAFSVYTGALMPDGFFFNDYYAPGTGVFDGRMVNGMGGNRALAIDAVTNYTYTVALKPGLTLSDESKALGWTEDSTGYHLAVDPAHNPIGGDSKSNLNNAGNYVPLVLDIIDGAKVTDIIGAQTISVTGTYTKEDGSTYSNTRQTNYSVDIPTAESSEGIFGINHELNGADSDIIKSYGRAYYFSSIFLSRIVPTDTEIDMTDKSFRVTTNNDNEFFYQVAIGTSVTGMIPQVRNGGQVAVYDDATGTLLHTFTKDNIDTSGGTSFTIPDNMQVKTLRYEFTNMYLAKEADSTKPQSIYHFYEKTYFADWPSIYNDTSINSLWSDTTASLTDDMGSFNLDANRRTELTRIVYNVNLRDDFPANQTTTIRNWGGGLTQRYLITNTATGRVSESQDMQTAAYQGELYQAYLVDPELKLATNSNLDVIYNWNNSGKDLYYEIAPVTATNDPIGQNVIQFANNFVKNGTYQVLTIGFWAEADPSFVPTDGIDLTAPINGITITAANSTTRITTVTLNASEASGVISQVKPDAANSYSFNASGNEAQDLLDFKITYSNVSPNDLIGVQVITSLPRTGDLQLDSKAKVRNSQFGVYLTGPVTPPAGWTAVYTTTSGTSSQMEAGTWLTDVDVTDWTTITAVKFVANGSVAPATEVNFFIDNARIGGDALQGEKAYLSSASSVGGAAYIESNNVLIEMARQIPNGTVEVKYVNEDGVEIAAMKSMTNDIKSDYDVSDKENYYPDELIGTDGLPYELVRTDDSSAPNTGLYKEVTQTVTHVYRLVPQTASFTFIDVTEPANVVQLGEVDNETGPSGADIAYDTQARINQYLAAGYELVSNNYTTDTKFDTDKTIDQAFMVNLRQRVEEVPTDVVPGTKVNPEDSNSPVWPNTTANLETSQTVDRAIEYKYIDFNGKEASATIMQTVTFTRKAMVNLVTGAIEYGDWTTDNTVLPEVVSPNIPGYTANQLVVGPAIARPDQTIGLTVVIYTPNEQVATVTYVDETTGETLETVNLNGVTDQAIGYDPAAKIAEYEAKGYEFVSEDVPEDAVYDNVDGNSQDFKVVLRHKIEPVTPDTVDPDTNTPVELSRTVTRTIEYKYLDENGQEASATMTQTVTFTRTATVDKVTGKVTYTDWTSEDAELDAVDSPVIAGYTPNLANVPALTVDADSEDIKVIVIYTAEETPAPNPDPRPEPHTTPDTKPVPVTSQESKQTSREEMLPNTGQSSSAILTIAGLVLSGLGLSALKRRKKEKEVD